MEPNPYESSSITTNHGSSPDSLPGDRLVSAVFALAATTLAGIPVGATTGFALMLALPRESMPSCGTTMLGVAALAGASLGLVCGLVLAWQILTQPVPPTTPLD